MILVLNSPHRQTQCFYNPGREIVDAHDADNWVRWELDARDRHWEWELPLLLLRDLGDGKEMGGRTESAVFDPFCVTTSVFALTAFDWVLNWLSGLVAFLSVLSALSGSVFCLFTCLEAACGAGGAGLAGARVLRTVCCDLIDVLSLSLCARAVIGDKRLEGFAEDINDSVRRGILLGFVLTRLFVGFFFWGFEAAAALLDCFGCCLTFRLLPFFFFPPSFASTSHSPFLPSHSAAGSCLSWLEGDEGLLLAEATRFLLPFPFLTFFGCSDITPPRRPFAAALARTSWTVSTFVGSAWKSKGSFDVEMQHIKTTGLWGNIAPRRSMQHHTTLSKWDTAIKWTCRGGGGGGGGGGGREIAGGLMAFTSRQSRVGYHL